MEKHPVVSRCPHCGSQSIEFLGKRRPVSSNGEQHRWRCLSSRCGRSFKGAKGWRELAFTGTDGGV